MKERIFKLREYSYRELSDKAKERAHDEFVKDFYNYCPYIDHIFSEMNDTIERFASVFDIDLNRTNWDIDCYGGYFTLFNVHYKGVWYYYDEEVYTEMTKERLMKFFQNNFGGCLVKGKFYHKSAKINGKTVFKKRYSKVIMTRDCVLTGHCYDNVILQPVYDFLDGKADYTDYDKLLTDCLRQLLKTVAEECSYFWTKENFIENYSFDYTYNEDGTFFTTPSNGVEITEEIQ